MSFIEEVRKKCCETDTRICWNSAFLGVTGIDMSNIGVLTENKLVGFTLLSQSNIKLAISLKHGKRSKGM